MSTATLKRTRTKSTRLQLGPYSAGILLSPAEFDRADFEEGWRYELIHGVLVVRPTPLKAERDPNDQLGHLFRTYQETHPQGKSLDATLPEEIIITGANRRRVDRVVWTGLGRLPTPDDVGSILVEFVSKGTRNWHRDYIEKRDEYMALGVKEYWIIDRFERTLTVHYMQGKRVKKRIVTEQDTYTTTLLPGFELPLARLLKLADAWTE